ncbi:MAG: ATP translocase [Gammaproteobacteria bacterium]|nr:ATP translocase [Gammaproteobacteria bacterium]
MPPMRHAHLTRSVLLFTNFFLIIAALYHLKPASRSLFIGALGSDYLPYVWIATAVGLALVIGVYHRLVARYSRMHVVLGSCAVFIACLLVFYVWLNADGFVPAFAFYVFVDMLSVILVEQFWSLTNSIHTTEDGKRWYGLIGTGGLLGGMAGGALSGAFITHLHLSTTDLLPIAAAILGLLMLLTLWMGRLGLYTEHTGMRNNGAHASGDWHAIVRHRYLLLIATILLLAQMVEPLVEFQFMKVVEAGIGDRETRTAYLGNFFSVLSAVAIGINLLITPLVHRWLGALGGLFAQPLAVSVGSLLYMTQASLDSGAFLKIADRGLSYSINRASKELLYVPIDPLLIYQAKAWIDMFGYRLFRVLGSVLILVLTQWLPWTISAAQLGWLVLGVCLIWCLTLLKLGDEYRHIAAHAAPAKRDL